VEPDGKELPRLFDCVPVHSGFEERKHGLYTEQFPVSAYVGSSKNLKDLKGSVPVYSGVGGT